MNIYSLTPVLTYSFGIYLLCSLPTFTQSGLAVSLSDAPVVVTSMNRDSVIQELTQAKVIYLGETHNNVKDHQAQILWDETMADAIVNFVKNNPDFQVIVLAGQGHIVYGYGVPKGQGS
ncbi:hypothetical protein PCC9214_03858 [Planktothrix tepida]|uniref:Haem-binding uptake Tiki superfamily ChaN domain-containing protein n=2 Tax=Planktothrix TaxID=54304 RepID=A0A1J1LPM5_9CYAN|nr:MULTISPECIES: ChaN family lipoprotein [Planktothrix]CAD5938952.1 hypothetical protein NO713_01791 [Planktothrix pseudagardhii]CAD5971707.1 hypothetical protein PCC9214_03858 [Planktothrix tepida]CUR34520.1 hypothetical protein PL9214640527 [Planktothrix tepida PCC 9214]